MKEVFETPGTSVLVRHHIPLLVSSTCVERTVIRPMTAASCSTVGP